MHIFQKRTEILKSGGGRSYNNFQPVMAFNHKGAGVGVGMMRVPGILLREKVYWFLGLLAIKFLGFKASEIYQIFISCFQEGIGQAFEDLIARIVSIFGAHLFEQCQTFWMFNILKFPQIIFGKMSQGFSLILFRCPGGSKDKHN